MAGLSHVKMPSASQVDVPHIAAAPVEPADGHACVLCGASGRPALDVAGYTIHECGTCGHRYLPIVPAPSLIEQTYGDEYFSGGGAGYNDYLSEQRLLTNRGRWYARLMARHSMPGTIVDVGAAAGFTLRGFQESGWQCQGVEPNGPMAEFAKQRLGLEVDVASWESWERLSSVDLITMLQVISHFADPRAALTKARQHVRPGGFVLIETWNRKSWTARVLGRHWHEYSPPSVLHWFSRDGLSLLARDIGLETVAHGRPAKWISAAHAQSLLKLKATDSSVNRLLYGLARLIPSNVSLPYLAEDLFWILLRRS